MYKYERILKHYGKDHQMVKAVEELAELSSAIMHYRDGRASRQAVVEEMADVAIMLTQLVMMLTVENDEMESIIERKLTSAIAWIAQREQE